MGGLGCSLLVVGNRKTILGSREVFKKLVTILEVFGDRVLSLIGLIGYFFRCPGSYYWFQTSSMNIVRWSESGRLLSSRLP